MQKKVKLRRKRKKKGENIKGRERKKNTEKDKGKEEIRKLEQTEERVWQSNNKIYNILLILYIQ